MKGKCDINSISFAYKENPHLLEYNDNNKMEKWDPKNFWCPDFIVATKNGVVVKFEYTQFIN